MSYKYNPFIGNLDISGSAVGSVLQIDTDSGNATPTSGIINVLGGTGIDTSGSSSTITISLTSPVSETTGGTGQTTYTTGDILYASAANTLSKLPAGSNGQVLTLAGGIPSWAAASGGVTGPGSSTDNAIVRWNGTGGTAIQDSSILIDDSNNISNLQNIVFDTSPASPGTAEGTLFWDATDHTLSLKNDQSVITQQLGQETLIRVRNESGAQIDNGKLVYISGAEAGGESRPLIALAQANSASTSAVVGMATQDIANTSYGYITSFGLVRSVDTSAFTAGDPVFLDATTAGDFTSTEPVSPNFSKAIGYVIVSDASNGTVLVSITPDTTAPAGDATELTVVCRKDSAGTINAGQVVYQSGYNVGQGVILVELADSDDASKMPALGIARDTFTNSASGTVVVTGTITGQNTASYSVGDQLYVDTTAGALTNVRPTSATTLVQKIGQVIRVNASNGVINIVGAGRSNDIPNYMSDAYFRIADDGDTTKLINFQASGIATGTTRTITMPNQNVDLTPTTGTFQASDADLTSLSGLSGTGMLARTGSATYSERTITGGNGITVTNGDGVSGDPDIALTSPTEVTGTSQSMAVWTTYIANNAGLVTLTLPSTAAVGDTVRVVGKGAGLFKIGQNAGQTINFLSKTTTTGVGGDITAEDQYGLIEIMCITANTTWVVVHAAGNFVVT